MYVRWIAYYRIIQSKASRDAAEQDLKQCNLAERIAGVSASTHAYVCAASTRTRSRDMSLPLGTIH
jgi:hypothetical protein